jgi:hypothetical protein
MKPVKNYSKGGRKNKGVNLINVYYMHVWKYHNEPPFYNEYTLIKKRKNKKDRGRSCFKNHLQSSYSSCLSCGLQHFFLVF